jgi:hypothetical protein
LIAFNHLTPISEDIYTGEPVVIIHARLFLDTLTMTPPGLPSTWPSTWNLYFSKENVDSRYLQDWLHQVEDEIFEQSTIDVTGTDISSGKSHILVCYPVSLV